MESGYLYGGLPYARIGKRSRVILLFDGLGVENKTPTGMGLRMFKLAFQSYLKQYSVFLVTRKQGLPVGYSTRDMSHDYARMVESEFSSPPHVVGLSTGGEIAQYFAADYPHLVNRLVLGSTAFRVGEEGKDLLRHWRTWALENRWTDIHVSSSVMYSGKAGRLVFRWMMRLLGTTLAGAPNDPSDYIVTIDADLNHDAAHRLKEIKAPTLLAGGTEDVFYPSGLIRETARRISNSQLLLYEGAGHKYSAGTKKRFDNDVLEFLADG